MKKLKFLFLVLIGILVSTAFTSCGSDDGPAMPSTDEIYKEWLEDARITYDLIKDDMAYSISDGTAILWSVSPIISGNITIPSEVYYEGTGKSYPVVSVTFAPAPELNKVTSITIPTSVQYCDVMDLNQLKTISIPSSVEHLYIRKCEELSTVNLTDGLNDFLITNCPKITSVVIPQTVTQCELIGLNISEVTVPSNLKSMEFRECKLLKAIHNLENTSLKGLGSRFLYNCESLKEIIIPKTASYICYGSCEGCKSLSNVHILRATPPTLIDSRYGEPFTVTDNLYVPKGCKEAYKSARPWSEFKEIIEE